MKKFILTGFVVLIACPCTAQFSWFKKPVKAVKAPVVVVDSSQLYCHAKTGSCYRVLSGKALPGDYKINDCADCVKGPVWKNQTTKIRGTR